ncbi:DUF692 family multinuclear iron-containing protein [Clostridium sp. BL-8]|uniref:multinuclear nonheme iron-dependent oxidase n=1 Tax=Clostridium sp. BL-8 TaxID=349938 RepID=UPI00098CA762|nr:DUF692 family multinuclear iron-containing protein [Clostridium sp. BL-8]OOM74235.1 hypothetical protein CLOBL_44110 [Clostridium sp. BL-8]
MYIGCNWSKALEILIERDAVKVDYIKAGAYGTFNEQFAKMRSLRPILLHGLGNFECTGMNNIEIVDFDLANKLIKDCSSPHYGLHLTLKNSDMYQGMTEENIYEKMCENIQIFKNNMSVPLLLENIPDTPEDRGVYDHYPYFRPEQINRLLVDNNVSFLLDISHAKITAQYHGLDVYDYISKLPLGRIVEIHVNGSGFDKDGFPADTHESIKEEDYRLLEWVLNQSNPDVVSLEYVGTKTEDEETIICLLQKQLKRLQNICSQSR